MRPRRTITEAELIESIGASAQAPSSQTAKELLDLADSLGLLTKQRRSSISIRAGLRPGDNPATLFVITKRGGLYTFWLDHWPQLFRRVRAAYGNRIRRLLGADVTEHKAVPLSEVRRRLAGLTLLVRDTARSIRRLTSGAIAQLDEAVGAVEGQEQLQMVRHRRREAWLRDARIALVRKATGGFLRCEVKGCSFDYHERYGPLGADYAQVHHLKPLANRSAPSQTDVKDLRVVCANCHAMIHRGGKSRSLGVIAAALRLARRRRYASAA